MTLTWYPPEDDGGSQVTGYIVERKEVRADRWVRVNKVPVTMTRYRSTGLIEGLEYEHRITAINARGAGKPSRPSKPIVAMDPIGKYVLYKEIGFLCGGTQPSEVWSSMSSEEKRFGITTTTKLKNIE